MKSRLVVLLVVMLFATSCARISAFNGPSFQEQLSELIQLRESGLISDKEYRILKRRIASVMLH